MAVKFGDYTADSRSRTLAGPGGSSAIAPRAFDILMALIGKPGEVLSKDDLFNAAWPGVVVEENTLQVHISALRKALPADFIVTVHGRGYRYAGPAPSVSADATNNAVASLRRPAIAVLPFTNMSSDREQEFFADGMTEDLITALSRIRELFVISRNSSFIYKGRSVRLEEVAQELGVRYVLEGSVRVSGDRVRVTAQLIDGTTGGYLWAERFDGDLNDIFAVQDDITRSIALALQIKLTYGDFARLWEGQTTSLRAWEKMANGRELFLRFNAIDNRQAQRVLTDALAIDPNYTGAMVLLGLTFWWDARFNIAADKDQCLTLAEAQADLAIGINPQMGSAYMLKGMNALLRDQHDDAIELCEKAIDLAPSDSWAVAVFGLVLVYAGDARAVATMKVAMRLSPQPPSWYTYALALAEIWAGDLAAAERAAEENMRVEGEDPTAHVNLATVYSLQGRGKDARRVVAEMRELAPAYSIANILRSERYREPEKLARVIGILREAGLPE